MSGGRKWVVSGAGWGTGHSALSRACANPPDMPGCSHEWGRQPAPRSPDRPTSSHQPAPGREPPIEAINAAVKQNQEAVGGKVKVTAFDDVTPQPAGGAAGAYEVLVFPAGERGGAGGGCSGAAGKVEGGAAPAAWRRQQRATALCTGVGTSPPARPRALGPLVIVQTTQGSSEHWQLAPWSQV